MAPLNNFKLPTSKIIFGQAGFQTMHHGLAAFEAPHHAPLAPSSTRTRVPPCCVRRPSCRPSASTAAACCPRIFPHPPPTPPGAPTRWPQCARCCRHSSACPRSTACWRWVFSFVLKPQNPLNSRVQQPAGGGPAGAAGAGGSRQGAGGAGGTAGCRCHGTPNCSHKVHALAAHSAAAAQASFFITLKL